MGGVHKHSRNLCSGIGIVLKYYRNAENGYETVFQAAWLCVIYSGWWGYGGVRSLAYLTFPQTP